jgi:hypothetical protein
LWDFGATRLGDLSNDMMAGAADLFAGADHLVRRAADLCRPVGRVNVE